ncbi:hypothetical protein LMG29542_02789 [Paraburkholderia humisilvae]|uniref:Uncharacterized protein n=1 Tax=Paraburkholderia humisilvae TaxID=627669 RepID=A0A6J5DQG5_9BURK|nr:hypothetical protein LMG29542_02789 [Paraburkholderia humisilvae]
MTERETDTTGTAAMITPYIPVVTPYLLLASMMMNTAAESLNNPRGKGRGAIAIAIGSPACQPGRLRSDRTAHAANMNAFETF